MIRRPHSVPPIIQRASFWPTLYLSPSPVQDGLSGARALFVLTKLSR